MIVIQFLLSVVTMSDVISVEVHSESSSFSPMSPEFPPDHFIPPRMIPLERQSTVQQVMTGKGQILQSNVGVIKETVGNSSPHAVWLRSTVGNHPQEYCPPRKEVYLFLF